MIGAIRARIGNFVLLIASIVTMLVVVEVGLVLFGYHYYPLKIELGKGESNDWRYYHLFGDRDFVYDPKLIWRPKTNRGIFNSQGFRGPVLAADKPAGQFRIFAIGDSNTLGFGGADGANWPGDLGRVMATRDPRVKVVNAGIWGYSSYQGLMRFLEVLDYSPDLVLISFGANDAHPVLITDAEFLKFQALKLALSHFRLGQLTIAAWDGWRQMSADSSAETLVNRVEVADYVANLGEIARLSKERGIICVILTRPYIGPSIDPTFWKTHAPAYLAATHEAATLNGALLIDIHEAFRDKQEFFADESHFNVEGHLRAANIIDRAIQPVMPEAPAAP